MMIVFHEGSVEFSTEKKRRENSLTFSGRSSSEANWGFQSRLVLRVLVRRGGHLSSSDIGLKLWVRKMKIFLRWKNIVEGNSRKKRKGREKMEKSIKWRSASLPLRWNPILFNASSHPRQENSGLVNFTMRRSQITSRQSSESFSSFFFISPRSI